MKRLSNNSNISDLFSLFKNYITIEDITNNLAYVYMAWETANIENNFEENYSSIDEWFLDYYTSIVNDCIRCARDYTDFDKKYNNLQIEEQEELKNEVQQYIFESKDEIVSLMKDAEVDR